MKENNAIVLREEVVSKRIYFISLDQMKKFLKLSKDFKIVDIKRPEYVQDGDEECVVVHTQKVMEI